MKFVCYQRDLLESILKVQKAISSRTPLPILKGIYIEALDNKIKLIGTDTELGIESYAQAKVLEKGATVVSSEVFGDVIRKFPEGDIEISLENNSSLKLKSFNSLITLRTLPAEEYPDLEQVQKENLFEIEEDPFKKMIMKTTFAASIDETRPELKGALLEVEEDRVNMVCLDGFKLAFRSKKLSDKPKQNIKMIIPARTLNEVARIIEGDEQRTVSIYYDDKHALFNTGDTRIISRLIEGEFINYRQIISQEYQTRIKLDTEILSESIERASLLARKESNNLIKFFIQEDELIITSNSEEGEAYEKVPILLEGKEMVIAFNARYFLDILKAIEDQEICIDFTTSVNPCVVRPLEGDHYTYLLLPVRISI